METTLWCQSCGMPMQKPDDFGTNADGTPNHDYCAYCYKDGAFTQELTMEEMIEHNLLYIDEFNKDSPKQFTVEEAREELHKFLPMLKRWKK
ncbi:zinc ribbon domain-containing protein [Alistipes sp. OttesenSCG-928-B03]|nr:zinc ribbon domain-containing protein [Alistipes sp. OttesenSCG-928-B03]